MRNSLISYSTFFLPPLRSGPHNQDVDINEHEGCNRQPWLARLCRWIPLVIGTGVVAAWILGYPLPLLVAATLLLVCPLICLVLYMQAKEAERQIAASVPGQGPAKAK